MGEAADRKTGKEGTHYDEGALEEAEEKMLLRHDDEKIDADREAKEKGSSAGTRGR